MFINCNPILNRPWLSDESVAEGLRNNVYRGRDKCTRSDFERLEALATSATDLIDMYVVYMDTKKAGLTEPMAELPALSDE